MTSVRFICAQPAIKYYAWQVEVMLNNFREMGANGYAARFFFYKDTRQTRHYISSIRPNILKQHFRARPEILQEAIFYHDCDIMLTRPIKEWLTPELTDDDVWYGSDTRWYIAHSYIKSKGQDVIDAMCRIMQLPESLIEENELNAIGAQYLMKHVTAEFWERVERDCETLFKDITALNVVKKAADPSHHELQIWCADMWAVLWGAWRLGFQTNCHKNFNFSWATSGIDEFNNCNIFHNAGITGNQYKQFYKADYMNSYPYNLNLEIIENTATRKYYDLVQETGRKSVLL